MEVLYALSHAGTRQTGWVTATTRDDVGSRLG